VKDDLDAIESTRHCAVVPHIADLELGVAVEVVGGPSLASVHLRLKAIKHPDFVTLRNQGIHKV